MNVLLFDYPGYGFSSGEPSEEAMEDAAIAVMEYVTTKLRKQASDVVVLGKSIGSSPAVSIVAHPVLAGSIRGLILIRLSPAPRDMCWSPNWCRTFCCGA